MKNKYITISSLLLYSLFSGQENQVQTQLATSPIGIKLETGGEVLLKENTILFVNGKITNLSTADKFRMKNNANIFQVQDIGNEGLITVEREVEDMDNVLSTHMDYVYWSTPVQGQKLRGTAALGGFSPGTPSNRFYEYNESNNFFYSTEDINFKSAKGYAIRAESGLPNGYDKTYKFVGIPNNGNINLEPGELLMQNGSGNNFIGNPYPSDINFDVFWNDVSNAGHNKNIIYGSAYFWTNNSFTLDQQGNNYSGNNYAIYNQTGGTAATINPINSDNNITIPDGNIKVGQGFIVKLKSGVGNNQQLNFNNSIRTAEKSNFFQRSSQSQNKNRYWITLNSPLGFRNHILIGYIDGATNAFEQDFDAPLLSSNYSDALYSVLDSRKLAIQGKATPFQIIDEVPLGNNFFSAGIYSISLDKSEGIFERNQPIYLIDLKEKKIANLSVEDYYFFTEIKRGEEDRFKIVYKESTLGADQLKVDQLQVYRDQENFVVKSPQIIQKIELYAITGQLKSTHNIGETIGVIDGSDLPRGVYLLKIHVNNSITIKKILK